MEMECKLQPATNILNSSFSSDIASLPSQNLGEISSFSDISDSEYDTREEISLRRTAFQKKSRHAVNGNNNLIKNGIKSKQEKNIDIDRSSSLQSLNDIKSTLQENEKLVNDRTLLDDIMKSIDNTIVGTTNKQNVESVLTNLPSEILLKNKDSDMLISSLQTNNYPNAINQKRGENKSKNQYENPTKQGVSKDIQMETMCNDKGKVNTVFGFDSLGPGMKNNFVEKQIKVSKNVSSLMKTNDRDVLRNDNQQKHVTFLNDTSEMSTKDEQDFLPNDVELDEMNNESHSNLQQKLLSHLSKIRWQLGGWEDIQLSPPDGERESQAFMNKVLQILQEQKLKKKHLEEELFVARNSIAKTAEELYVLRRLKETRNARLKEADTQLKILHSEWARSQKESKNDIVKLNRNCAQLKEVKKQLERQIEDLRHQNNNLNVLKTENHTLNITIEEMRMQLTESRRHSVKVVEENEKLNFKVQELTPKLKHLEEVEMPKREQDWRVLQDKFLRLEEEVKTTALAKLHIEGDLDLLKKQHSSLLQKVSQGEEQKLAVTKECDKFKSQYMDIQQQIYSSKEEIRCHYQKQMEDLMAKKSENFQEQLNNHVTGLKENLLGQLNTQRDAHNHQNEVMRKEHKEEIDRLNNHWQSQITQLERELHSIKYMNEKLIAQRKGFIVAVTAILGPNEAQNLVGTLSNQHLNNQSSFTRHINHEITKKPSTMGKPLYDDPSTCSRSHTTERLVKRRSVHSRNNSRPNSGTTKESLKLPLIVGNDTSCESDASDGPTTVRHAVLGQNRNGNSNFVSNVEPKILSHSTGNRNTYGSRNIVNSVASEIPITESYHKNKYHELASNVPMQHTTVFNISSKPNCYEKNKEGLSSKSVIGSSSRNMLKETDCEGMSGSADKYEKHMPSQNETGTNKVNHELLNHLNQKLRNSHLLDKQKSQNHEGTSYITNSNNKNQVLYLASDILEANDTLDSNDSEMQKTQVSIVDDEMARLVEELKKLQGSSVGVSECSFPSADDEVPTHDTSVEPDPASVALHKINQVSTLLTQYVHEN